MKSRNIRPPKVAVKWTILIMAAFVSQYAVAVLLPYFVVYWSETDRSGSVVWVRSPNQSFKITNQSAFHIPKNWFEGRAVLLRPLSDWPVTHRTVVTITSTGRHDRVESEYDPPPFSVLANGVDIDRVRAANEYSFQEIWSGWPTISVAGSMWLRFDRLPSGQLSQLKPSRYSWALELTQDPSLIKMKPGINPIPLRASPYPFLPLRPPLIGSIQNTAVYLAGIVLVWVGFSRSRRGVTAIRGSFRERRGRCRRCNYPSGGKPVCPECGEAYRVGSGDQGAGG